jgi:DNA polymerase III epsilon subunit-like protein
MQTDLRTARFAFVDVETTGFDPVNDRIVEFACIVTEGGAERTRFATLVDPQRPIPAAVSAIHHITARHVASQPRLADIVPTIERLARDAVVVAHNARFDLSFLPMLAGHPRICTLRLARHLVRGVANYTNQTLRYELAVDDPELDGAIAHRALGDVLVTRRVFERLLEIALATGFARDVEGLIARIGRPARLERLWFGKYRGRELAEIPSDYLDYVCRNFGDDPDVRHSARTELQRRAEGRA